MEKRAVSLLLFLTLLFSSCASFPGKDVKESYPLDGDPQIGIASWYGIEEHGKKAASGERFSLYDYSAAHRSLPMETVVRVTSLENGRDVIVRINDRGPFVDGRIIDLSYAAAEAIDMLRSGTARVKVEVISTPNRPNNFFEANYTVQVASFRDREKALNLKKKLDRKLDDVRIETQNLDGGIYYRVRVGRFSEKGKAEKLADKLQKSGYRGAVILE